MAEASQSIDTVCDETHSGLRVGNLVVFDEDDMNVPMDWRYAWENEHQPGEKVQV